MNEVKVGFLTPEETARRAALGPLRPIPPGAWQAIQAHVRSESVPAAALLSAKASFTRWESDGTAIVTMPQVMVDQFRNSERKQRVFLDAFHAVLGSGFTSLIVQAPGAYVAGPKETVSISDLRLKLIEAEQLCGVIKAAVVAAYKHDRRSAFLVFGPGECWDEWPPLRAKAAGAVGRPGYELVLAHDEASAESVALLGLIRKLEDANDD